MYLNEAYIINGCRRGKHRAQKALFDRYHPVLMGICVRYAKSNAEAEDILLVGLTRIFNKINDYSGRGSFEGYTHKEIAEKLNITESTSKTQLMKARKKLKQKLLLLESVPEIQPFIEKKNIVEPGKIF